MLRSACVLTGLLAVALSGCGGSSGMMQGAVQQTIPAAKEDAPEATRLIGRVVRRAKKTPTDTGTYEPVPDALITTEPRTDKVTTDADGIFKIEHGVSQLRYRILVEAADQTGKSAPVRAEANKTISNIVIVLGEGESAWPPPMIFEAMIPKLNQGPARVRCCDR